MRYQHLMCDVNAFESQSSLHEAARTRKGGERLKLIGKPSTRDLLGFGRLSPETTCRDSRIIGSHLVKAIEAHSTDRYSSRQNIGFPMLLNIIEHLSWPVLNI